MPTLRSQLDSLAANFADQIIAAIQGASVQELVGSGSSSIGNRRGPASRVDGDQPDPLSVPRKSARHAGRLARRSPEEIAGTLNKVVRVVKTHRNGMRAEEIRATLGMEAKEMPRILKEGIATKKLTTKGLKRATTYFAR